MAKNRPTLRDLHNDDRGVAMVEYWLLLAVFGLPLFFLFGAMLTALTDHYRMVTFLETLPFP